MSKYIKYLLLLFIFSCNEAEKKENIETTPESNKTIDKDSLDLKTPSSEKDDKNIDVEQKGEMADSTTAPLTTDQRPTPKIDISSQYINYIFIILLVFGIITILSTSITFYLYRWRKQYSKKTQNQIVVPEEFWKKFKDQNDLLNVVITTEGD